MPIAVGFGVATTEDAARVAQVADGVIVGSAIVRRIADRQQDPRLAVQVGAFVRSLKAAMHPRRAVVAVLRRLAIVGPLGSYLFLSF